MEDLTFREFLVFREFRQHYRDVRASGGSPQEAKEILGMMGASHIVAEAIEYLESDEHEAELE